MLSPANLRGATALFVAAAPLLLGCALGYLSPNYVLPGERRDRLSEAANRYANFLRFGNLEMAAPFVEPDLRGQFISVFGGSERSSLRFTEVEVANVEFADLGRATVLLQVRVYRLPSVREVMLTETQKWRFDPLVRKWYLTPDFELYGPRGGAPRGVVPPAVH